MNASTAVCTILAVPRGGISPVLNRERALLASIISCAAMCLWAPQGASLLLVSSLAADNHDDHGIAEPE